MTIEYEVKFLNIDKDSIRDLLKLKLAILKRPEFMQKRSVFNLPNGHEIDGAWLRVRDESDKITMSLKITKNNAGIENQREIELKIDNYKAAVELLEIIGCENKAYQETLREIWELDNCMITIDTWPFLDTLIEIESDNEQDVKNCVDKLGFDYSKAYTGAVDELYAQKYNISTDKVNNHTPKILFNMEKNPFLD